MDKFTYIFATIVSLLYERIMLHITDGFKLNIVTINLSTAIRFLRSYHYRRRFVSGKYITDYRIHNDNGM